MKVKSRRFPALAILLGCFWVALQGADVLVIGSGTKIDTKMVVQSSTKTFSFGFAPHGGHVWVAGSGGNIIWEIKS